MSARMLPGTTYVSGGAVKNAAELVRTDILKIAAEMLHEDVNNLTYHPAETQTSKCHIAGKKGQQVSLREISLYAMNQGTQQIMATRL